MEGGGRAHNFWDRQTEVHVEVVPTKKLVAPKSEEISCIILILVGGARSQIFLYKFWGRRSVLFNSLKENMTDRIILYPVDASHLGYSLLFTSYGVTTFKK